MEIETKAARQAMSKGTQQIKSDEKVDQLKALARKARDDDAELQDLKERVRIKEGALRFMFETQLPMLMTELGFDHIGVPAEGNLPGVDFKLKKTITANISSNWSDEQKQNGFEVLKKYDAEALIKAQVKAILPKGQVDLARRLLAQAEKLGISASLTEEVHYQTLSADDREVYSEGTVLSTKDLEAIGAFVGLVVKPTERK